MKAATLYKQCKSGRGVSAPAANTRRDAGAHLPKRRAVQASAAVQDSEDPRLTVIWNDSAVEVELKQASGHITVPRVLLIDMDQDTAAALTTLLVPEAQLVHAGSVLEARRLLETQLFSMVIIDPVLKDGNMVIHAVHHTPLLIYSANEPLKHELVPYLNKPYTTPRELWSTISRMLGIGGLLASED
jgi:hypothetical protein